MEFINEIDFNDINLFINTNEDTIDIFDDNLETLDDDLDISIDDEKLYDKFIDNKNKINQTSYRDDLDEIEQAVMEFKNTRCEQVFNKIYNKYSKTIKDWSIRSSYKRQEESDDLYSDVMGFVLLNCIEAWDPDKPSKFNTFFWTCVKYHMSSKNKKKQAYKRTSDNTAVSIHGTNGINKEGEELALEGIIVGQEDVVDKYFDLNITIDNLKTVSDRNKLILKMTMNGYTFDEISKETGITGAAAKLFLKRFGTTPEGKLFYKLLKNI